MKHFKEIVLLIITILSFVACSNTSEEVLDKQASTTTSSEISSSKPITSSQDKISSQESVIEDEVFLEPEPQNPLTTLQFLDKSGVPLSNITILSEQFISSLLASDGKYNVWEIDCLKQPLVLDEPQAFIIRDYISSKEWTDQVVMIELELGSKCQQVTTNLTPRNRAEIKGSKIEVTIVDENGTIVKDAFVECCRRDQIRPQKKKDGSPEIKFTRNGDKEMEHFEEEHYGCLQYTDENGKAYFVVEPNDEYNIYVYSVYGIVNDKPAYTMSYVKSTAETTAITIPIDLS